MHCTGVTSAPNGSTFAATLAEAGLFAIETAAEIADARDGVNVHPLEEYRKALPYELIAAKGTVRHLLELNATLEAEPGQPAAYCPRRRSARLAG